MGMGGMGGMGSAAQLFQMAKDPAKLQQFYNIDASAPLEDKMAQMAKLLDPSMLSGQMPNTSKQSKQLQKQSKESCRPSVAADQQKTQPANRTANRPVTNPTKQRTNKGTGHVASQPISKSLPAAASDDSASRSRPLF